MAHHIPWPDGKENAPVWIDIGNGAEEILTAPYISTKLKEPGLATLGLLLDADSKPAGRYDRIRHQCMSSFPDFPEQLPHDGLVVENEDSKRLGVWIMPDNYSAGALEVFLRHLVPSESEPIWEHAMRSVLTAKNMGASCKDCHLDKSNLYTWLAWQDEPGQYPGNALTKKVLNPHSDSAVPFISWFRRLYNL